MVTGLRMLAFLVFCLVILGGAVRITGAGLACPDWPMCNGRLVPAFDFRILMEWSHRFLAGIVGIGTLIAAIGIFRAPLYRKSLGAAILFALACLAFQVFLGAATVWELLSPYIVTLHLAVGYAFFGVFLWMALRAPELSAPGAACDQTSFGCFQRHAVVAAVVVYLQVILGGLVSSHAAGIACPDFPMCNGMWIPPMTGLIPYQFAHRVGALLTTIIVFILILRAGKYEMPRRGRIALWFGGILVLMQIVWGVGLIHSSLALGMRLIHVATAISLFAASVITAYDTCRLHKRS